MHRFFLDSPPGDEVTITGQDVVHIRSVLRLSAGDRILVGDGSSRDYLCEITSVEEKKVTAKVCDIFDNFAELPSEITLYQGLPKGDKMELILQKAVELGVSRIIPVEMDRSVVRLDASKKEKKLERYRKIAESAAKQCGRGILPETGPFMSFAKALQDGLDRNARLLIPYENAEGIGRTKRILQELEPGRPVAVFIGPEGGFSDQEIAMAEEKGAETITLGHRILRTETAGLFMLSLLSFQLENEHVI